MLRMGKETLLLVGWLEIYEMAGREVDGRE
jgi:hypothetical protein